MEEVYCELKYSGLAEAFLALAVGTTLAVAVFQPFPDWARAMIFAWVIGLASHARGRLHDVRALRMDHRGHLELQHADGRWRPACLRDGSFVTPFLTIIRWRPEGALCDRTLLLLPGMVGNEPLRQIRVILRLR